STTCARPTPGRTTADRHHHHLPLLRRRLQPRTPRPRQPDRQGHLTPRPRRRQRPPVIWAHPVGFPSQRGEILLKGEESLMGETRRKFDRDFREGAVRLVRETGKPIAQVARDLGINEGTLGNWVNADKRRRGDGTGALDEDERAELARLRKENAELAMERD